MTKFSSDKFGKIGGSRQQWVRFCRKSSSKIEKTEKDEDDTTAKKEEPDDEEGGDNQTDGDSEEADPENPEEADIRDVRHKLEKLKWALGRGLLFFRFQDVDVVSIFLLSSSFVNVEESSCCKRPESVRQERDLGIWPGCLFPKL